MCFFCVNKIDAVFATPENALNETILAEKLLLKLQSADDFDTEIELMYRYLEIICQENTQFFSYNIDKLENLMDKYREHVILQARNLAGNKEYKSAVEFLESKSEIFKDKSTINSLIQHYSKYFVKDGLVYYAKSPKFLSINKLIANPSEAFFEDNPKSEELDNHYLTSKEFQNLLSELYLNDYILINLSDFLEFSEDCVLKKDLYIPNGKIPVVLFFNNINYCDLDTCFVEKFIIDGKDNVACYNKKQTEKNQISYNTDFIPILENFVAEHSDFNFNNAKAVITFDKNFGILGYNISKTNPNASQDSATLKKLVTKLKQLGYVFGYGNFDKNATESSIQEDFGFFKENILPVFGTMNIYFSDYKTYKTNDFYSLLSELGFKIFVCYGENFFQIKNGKIFISTKNMDGKALREKSTIVDVDYEKIYDHNSRTKIF